MVEIMKEMPKYSIEDILNSFGFMDKLVHTSDVKYLEQELMAGEEILGYAVGWTMDRNGMIFITTKRVIFITKGLASVKMEQFPLDKISSYTAKKGFALGEITVISSGNKCTISKVPNNMLDKVKFVLDTILNN